MKSLGVLILIFSLLFQGSIYSASCVDDKFRDDLAKQVLLLNELHTKKFIYLLIRNYYFAYSKKDTVAADKKIEHLELELKELEKLKQLMTDVDLTALEKLQEDTKEDSKEKHLELNEYQKLSNEMLFNKDKKEYQLTDADIKYAEIQKPKVVAPNPDEKAIDVLDVLVPKVVAALKESKPSDTELEKLKELFAITAEGKITVDVELLNAANEIKTILSRCDEFKTIIDTECTDPLIDSASIFTLFSKIREVEDSEDGKAITEIFDKQFSKEGRGEMATELLATYFSTIESAVPKDAETKALADTKKFGPISPRYLLSQYGKQFVSTPFPSAMPSPYRIMGYVLPGMR